jgi:hypothetical protein
MAEKRRDFGDVDPYAADAALADPEQDELGRRQFCQRVAETIAARQNAASLCVGIYGEWGEGKSTALNFIKSELSAHSHIVCVEFNPWRFGDEAQLLVNFFNTLADALGTSLTSNKEKIGGVMRDYVSSIVGAVKISPSVFGVSLGEVNAGETVKQFGEKLAAVSLDEQKKKIEGILRDELKRVVVLMDDIDRLEKTEVQTVFRLIKLTADFAYTTYVLAFDDERVAESLGERYGSGDAAAGRDFLEKIIQVPLHLPKADVLALRDFCSKGINDALALARIELDEEQQQYFAWSFVKGIEKRLRTPRQCRRYANALAFALPILRGEVHPVDVMLVEAMRVFYPRLYDTVREHPGIFLGTDGGSRVGRTGDEQSNQGNLAVINEGLSDLNESEKDAARNLLESLFPHAIGVLDGHGFRMSGMENRWEREQRVTSPNYFNRYFSYAVPVGDIPDGEIQNFLERTDHEPVENVSAEMKRLIAGRNDRDDNKDRRAKRLLWKIEQKAKTFTPDRSRKLALAIARIGSDFQRPKGEMMFLTTFAQAGDLVRELLRNLPAAERQDFAKQLVGEADTLSFALECLRVATTNKESREQSDTLTPEGESELSALVIGKIKEHARDEQPLYLRFPRDANYLLKTWARRSSRDETNAYVRATLESSPGAAVELLKRFASFVLGVPEEQAPFLEQSNYESVVEIVDADVVYDALVKSYGAEIGSTEYPQNRTLRLDERLARQFAYLHNRSKVGKESEPNTPKIQDDQVD